MPNHSGSFRGGVPRRETHTGLSATPGEDLAADFAAPATPGEKPARSGEDRPASGEISARNREDLASHVGKPATAGEEAARNGEELATLGEDHASGGGKLREGGEESASAGGERFEGPWERSSGAGRDAGAPSATLNRPNDILSRTKRLAPRRGGSPCGPP